MPDVGRKASGNHTQSVIFKKDCDWTEATAKKWLKEHDYFTDGMDETENSFRFRQYDPEANKFRYRNEIIEKKGNKDSIILVLGFPKGTKAENNKEDEGMSISKQLDESLARIEELTQATEASANEQKKNLSERDAQIAEAQNQVKAKDAEIAVLKSGAETAKTEAETKANEIQGKLDTMTKELETVKQKLVNPAFVDAAAQGQKPVADGGEAKETKGDKSLYEQYMAIEDPIERTRFWNAHEKNLKAEAQKLFGVK